MIMQTAEILSRTREDPDGFIRFGRAAYRDQIYDTAKALRQHASEIPIILLAGPSGSGKTTSALLIEQLLEQWGIETYTLSMDNYFAPLTEEEKVLLRQHKIDLESPKRVDAAFLNEQLRDIVNCRQIRLPRYDFPTSSRVFDGRTFCRKPGQLVIMEGIHALNPEVTGESSDFSARIYVSVRTRVGTEDGTVLHPSKIRLMRRMLRDNIFRGRSFEDTIANAPSVDRGENLYIMPYRQRAAYHINTFVPYELSVYKNALFEPLTALQEQHPELRDIVKVLDEIAPIDAERVPKDSLIREFIGGSIFEY